MNMQSNEVVIELKGVCFSHGQTPVLSNIHLKVPALDFLAIVGPNGGGKTTLLKLILGLLSPDKGSITVFGMPPVKARQRIGYMPQRPSYNPSFPITVFDMVLSGRIKSGFFVMGYDKNDRKAAEYALELTGLTDYKNARMEELSGGQVQRALLARAVVNRPLVLLLDEPTANIDVNGKMQFTELFSHLNQDTTLIMVSHDLDLFSKGIKRIACVNHTLYLHAAPERGGPSSSFRCPAKEVCPVELLTHLHFNGNGLNHV